MMPVYYGKPLNAQIEEPDHDELCADLRLSRIRSAMIRMEAMANAHKDGEYPYIVRKGKRIPTMLRSTGNVTT
jgi:hypothetical protein